MPEKNRFHYCGQLEDALREFYGDRWYNRAGGFAYAESVRDALIAAVTQIRKRLDNIALDDRLLLTTSLTLDALDRQARAVSDANNNDLEIIAELLRLLAFLLGFDWREGKPNREVIYFQTAEQEFHDYERWHHKDLETNLTLRKRIEVVGILHDQGLKNAQIAQIMKVSPAQVRDLLISAGKIEPRKPIQVGDSPEIVPSADEHQGSES